MQFITVPSKRGSFETKSPVYFYLQFLCSQDVAFQGVIGKNITLQIPYYLIKNVDGIIKT